MITFYQKVHASENGSKCLSEDVGKSIENEIEVDGGMLNELRNEHECTLDAT